MRNMHDTINTSIIKKLAQRRRKILLYLKRIDRVRFDKCLQEIGVDQRAIEGEIAVHRFWFVVCSCSSHGLSTADPSPTLPDSVGVRSRRP